MQYVLRVRIRARKNESSSRLSLLRSRLMVRTQINCVLRYMDGWTNTRFDAANRVELRAVFIHFKASKLT